MPELHLKHPRFTYSASDPVAKDHKRIQTLRETCNLKKWYRKELDKVCFVHDAAYCDNKDLAKQTVSDKRFER